MPRRSWVLWAAAVLTSAAPTLYFWVASLLTGGETVESYFSAVVYPASCPGWEIYDRVYLPAYPVIGFPLLATNGAPLVVLGLAGWWLSVRRGRVRLGRIIGRCVAVVLLVLALPGFLTPTLDAALGPGCAQMWGPPEVFSWQIGWSLYDSLPPLLMLLAVRVPRRVFVRRGPVARTATAVLTVAAVVLLPAASAASGRVSAEWELDCAGFGDGTVKGLTTAERHFLCAVRGYGLPSDPSYDSGVEGWDEASDEAVLAQGRHLCALATRHGGDIGARAVEEAPEASLATKLAFLCPAVAGAQQAEEERRQAESDAYVAEKEQVCAALPRHRPEIRPVRQRRATMWTEFWTIDGWEEGYEGDPPDLVRDLVGSGRGTLAIWAADEVGHACVTVESYTRRPPVETRGWEEVVEVAYESPTGALELVDGDGRRLTGLTTRGPGSYRVRVHLRGRKLVYQVPDPPDGAVRILIEVFPGRAKKTVVYK
ncbi:hypothetical protein [Microbispora triticiradicis]|uniref:Uncharacterized protein n=2 Tax=Microbispora TaxID=2005 RepID=A0ABY3M1Z3_9ACTN|nr:MULTISPECIES: hypothetical protein [Microbispora]TLP62429.1 hypothetical protein FED44_10840 [Microbispora fusca]TYB62460.1 hypothetical protein FXF59_10545 [Microbispora tritici]